MLFLNNLKERMNLLIVSNGSLDSSGKVVELAVGIVVVVDRRRISVA